MQLKMCTLPIPKCIPIIESFDTPIPIPNEFDIIQEISVQLVIAILMKWRTLKHIRYQNKNHKWTFAKKVKMMNVICKICIRKVAKMPETLKEYESKLLKPLPAASV